MNFSKKQIWFGLTFLLGLLLFFSWILFSSIVEDRSPQPHSIEIPRGTRFSGVVDEMLKRGVIKNEVKLQLAARIMGSRDEIKAGRYRIEPGASSYDVLKQFVDGRVALEKVTIPEGLQAKQIASILQARIELDSAKFMEAVFDSARASKFRMSSLEGMLFPDTYKLDWGMSASQVVEMMLDQFNRAVGDSLRQRMTERGWTLRECLAMASIIEGETVVDSERPIVSAVYHNRLRKGMRLQADPTIQYIIDDGPRRLLNRDLKIDSPYNTYMYSGLPPGPINNPGLASIKASLYPADVDYLFFVANGDGSHTFTRTLKEHLRAKARFDEHRRQVRRNQTKDDDAKESQ